MNLLDQFKEYLFAQKQAPTKVTVKNYSSDINHFIKWFEDLYNMPFSPQAVSLKTITEFRTAKADALSQASLNRHLSSLRKFFHFLKIKGIVSRDVFGEEKTNNMHASPNDPWRLKDFKNHLYVSNSSPLTIKNYVIDLKQFLTWALEVNPKADPTQILSLVNSELIEEYKTRLGSSANFSPASVNRKLSSLRRYFAWTKAEGLTPEYAEPEASKRIIKVAANLKQAQAATKKDFVPRNKLVKILHLPFQLFDEFLTFPLAFLHKTTGKIAWRLGGKPIFKNIEKDITRRFPLLKPNSIRVSNVSKEFYAPTASLIRNLPIQKRIIFHIRHTRPNWYKKHRNAPLAIYFQYAVVVLLVSAMAFAFFNAFVEKPGSDKGIFASGTSPTAPPRILSFQGRLTDSSDNPITTQTNIRFQIYDSSSATGSGHLVWQEVDNVTPDNDGIFSVLLGNGSACSGQPLTVQQSPCAIDQSVFAYNSTLYLGATIGTTPELTPRQQIATVAFAANSETLQGMVPITNTSATTNVILALNSSGNLSIGGSANPTFQATGGSFTLKGNSVTISTNTNSNGDILLLPDGSGKVGIGTASPSAKLHVTGAVTGQALAIFDETGDQAPFTASASGVSIFTIAQSAGTDANGFTFTSGAAGSGVTQAATGSDTNIDLSIDSKGSGALNLNNNASGDILLGGGVGSTGCTVTNSNGNLACSGNVTGGATGIFGYWTRTGTTLSPATPNDVVAITTSTATALTLTQTGAFDALLVEDQAADPTPFVIDQTGNVGIGTATPTTFKVEVAGNVGPTVGSTYDLGSSARRWATIYGDTANFTNIVGTVTGGSTTSNDWLINSDNVTADTEDATLTFERGTAATNTQFRWNSTTKQLTTNTPSFAILPDPTIAFSGTAALIVNQVQNQDIFTASASGTTRFTVANDGDVILNGGDTITASSLTTFTTAATLSMPSTTTLNLGAAATINSAATALNLQADGAIDVNIAGGSAATGCTVANTTGDLTCTGNIIGAATGTSGYWTRTGNTLSPATPGDNVTTSGNISTTGTGTITSAGTLTASNGFTMTTGALNLTSTSGSINSTGLTGVTLTASSGNIALTSSAGAVNLTANAASTFALRANTNNALRITDGTNSYIRVDTRTTTNGIPAVSIEGSAPTLSSGATVGYSTLNVGLAPAVVTLTGSTNVTSTGASTILGMLVYPPTITSASPLTVAESSGLMVYGAPIAAGSTTITTSSAIKIPAVSVAGGGTVTNAYGLYVDAPTGATNNYAATFASGNVGIGDTTPATLFTVGSGDLFQVNSSGNVNFNQTAPTISIGNTGSLVFNDGTNTLCTITDAGTTGNLSCTGNITGAATGTAGYWTRTGTTLTPATAGDSVNVGDGGNFTAGQTTGKIGFGGAVSGSDYLINVTLDSTQDWSRGINITQANDSAEDSTVINIANTANVGAMSSGTITRNIKNADFSLTPTATITMPDSGIKNLNIYGIDQTLTLSGITVGDSAGTGRANIKGYGNNVTVTGSPVVNDTAGNAVIENFSYAGYNADVSLTPTFTSDAFGSQTSIYGGLFNNTSSTTPTGNTTITSYGISANASGNLTMTGATTHYGGYFSASGTADNNYAINIAGASGATNNYGLYIDNVAAAPTNYALYSNAAAQSYFAGSVGIGTTTPTTFKLETAGSIGPSVGSTYDLGSSARRWANVWGDVANFTSFTATNATISGTASNDFTINSDNTTNDTEDATLTFERGTPTTNAQFRWNSTTKQITTNTPSFVIAPDNSIAFSGTAALIVDQIQAEDIFTASSSGVSVFTVAQAAGTDANGFTFTSGAAGSGVTQAATGTDTNIALSIDAKGTGALNLNNTGTGDILLGGGSGSTGCTVTNSNGDLTCSGAISSTATSGNQGWWTRTGTTLSPTNSGDNITTSGAITGGAGSFTTLTSSGATTLGTGSGLTNTFGSGASSVNTIGSTTTPGQLTLHGSTVLDNNMDITGTAASLVPLAVHGLNADTRIQLKNDAAVSTGNTARLDLSLFTTTQTRIAAEVIAQWTDTTDATRNSRLDFVTLNSGTVTTAMSILGANVGIGNTTPVGKLDVSGAVTGKALTIFNETGDQAPFTASVSGKPVFTIANAAGTDTNGFTFTGSATTVGVTQAATGTDTNIALSIDAKGTGALNLNNTGTGDILLGGGSGSTGCTVTNSTGDFTCTGNITGAATGTAGYWKRLAGNLSPATANDTISATTSAAVALTITQTGAFNALLVEDQASDTSPFVIDQSGNVGIGDASPDAFLEVLGATEQLRLTFTDGTVDSRFTVDSSGNLNIDNTGTKTTIVDDLQITGNDILDSGATSRITLGSTTTLTNTSLSLPSTVTTTMAGAGNVTLEFGRTDGSSSTPHIDFHSGATAVDYDSRIIASGGTGAIEGGTLTIAAATAAHSGVITVDGSSGNAITISNTGITTDLVLQNGESIDNNTNNQINLNIGASGTLLLTSTTTSTITNSAGALAVNAAATGLNLQADGTIDVNIAGGSGATGCTITNSTGALACTAGISGGAGTFTDLTATGNVTFNDAGADNILIGAAADTVTITADTLSLTDNNWNITAAGAANFVSVGATTAGSGAFTTLTSSSTTTLGNGSGVVTSLGNSGGAAAINLTSGTGAQTFTSSVATGTTTTSAFVFRANSLTTGTGLDIASTSMSTGTLVRIAPTFGNGAGGTGYGLYIDGTDTSANGNSDYAIYSTISNTGAAGKSLFGLRSAPSTSNTTSDTDSVYGVYTSITAQHNTDAGTVNGYGLYVANGTMTTNGTSTQYGLYVEGQTGADTNYAAIFAGGNVGIGDTTPDYTLELSGATAPKFALADTELAHGITGVGQTDSFFLLNERTNDDGGAIMYGLSDAVGTIPMTVVGYFGSTDPTDSVPAINLVGGKRSGTGGAAVGALETVLRVDNDATSGLFTILGSGNVGIGTTTPTFTSSTLGSVTTAGKAVAAITNTNTTDSANTVTLRLNTGAANTTTNARFITFYAGCTTEACAGSADGHINLNNNAVNYGTTGADFGERFLVGEATNFGDVIATTTTGNMKAVEGQKILGVVSDTTGFTGNDDDNLDKSTHPSIGLLGQVKTKVSTENGAISRGDFLAASPTQPGVAVKATKAGQAVGVALESYNSGSVGKILVFVNPNWHDPDVYLTDSGNLSITQNPNNSYSVKNQGTDVSRIGAFAEAVIAKLRVGLLSASDITTNTLAVATDSVNIAGKTLSQYISDIVDQRLQDQNTQSFISPMAEIDVITPRSGNNLAIKLKTNDTNSKVEVQNASGSAVATIDAAGNASFSGQLKSNSLDTNEASVSGTIRAKKIIADQIEGLNVNAATVSANYITNNYYASPSAVATSSAAPDYNASGSASLENLVATTGTFTSSLMSFGPASLNEVSVIGQLSVGSRLFLADNTINVLGSDLEIQPLKQGGVSFEGGLVYINTSGDLTVKGNADFAKNVSIKGILSANVIAPFYNKDLVIKLGGDVLSASDSASSLIVKNASDSSVLTVNQKGDVTASGGATFAKLNLPSSDAVSFSQTEIEATGSAGLAKIKSGQTHLTIKNSAITANSLIYITPKADTTDTGAIFIENQVAGDSFVVKINNSISDDLPFNWIIIN